MKIILGKRCRADTACAQTAKLTHHPLAAAAWRIRRRTHNAQRPAAWNVRGACGALEHPSHHRSQLQLQQHSSAPHA